MDISLSHIGPPHFALMYDFYLFIFGWEGDFGLDSSDRLNFCSLDREMRYLYNQHLCGYLSLGNESKIYTILSTACRVRPLDQNEETPPVSPCVKDIHKMSSSFLWLLLPFFSMFSPAALVVALASTTFISSRWVLTRNFCF